MTLTELEAAAPALKEYTKNMPEDIRSRCTVRTHAAGSIIHQKNMELGISELLQKVKTGSSMNLKMEMSI